jgi:ribosomal protein S18 acetylase RimI-like enzyme
MLLRLTEGAESARLLWGVRSDAENGDDGLRGYLAGSVRDSFLHLEEISVDRRCRRRRLGTALVRTLQDASIERAMRGVTLTTDRVLPSNIDFFRGLGFVPTDASYGPDHLRRAMTAERKVFADPSRRVPMLWLAPDS